MRGVSAVILGAVAILGGVVMTLGASPSGSPSPPVQATRQPALEPVPRFSQSQSVSTQARPAGASDSARTLLDKYCVTCHDQRRHTAGLTLDTMDPERVGGAAEKWEKVLRKLHTREMPPAGSPRPDAATYIRLASSLEAALDREASVKPNPGNLPPL